MRTKLVSTSQEEHPIQYSQQLFLADLGLLASRTVRKSISAVPAYTLSRQQPWQVNISFISTNRCPRLGHTSLPSSQPRGTSAQTSAGQSWGPPVGHTPTGSPTRSQGHGRGGRTQPRPLPSLLSRPRDGLSRTPRCGQTQS